MVPSDRISVELHIVAAKEPTQRILGCTRFHFLLFINKSSTYVVSEIAAVGLSLKIEPYNFTGTTGAYGQLLLIQRDKRALDEAIPSDGTTLFEAAGNLQTKSVVRWW